MFSIRFVTEKYAPGQSVVMRWAPEWDVDRGGVFTDGAWTFELDEGQFPAGIEFKFVLTPGIWMNGPNLVLTPEQYPGPPDFDEGRVVFPAQPAAITERGAVPQRFFVRNLTPDHEYDVIVVGSGMGGGILASKLADAGADVLLLEAGSYLFPTHVGNLPRRLQLGLFDKHVWGLWPEFSVRNYTNMPGSEFAGGQGFNLGGRSIFWGGLIPRQEAWELAAWPAAVRDYLLGNGYPLAEAQLNAVLPSPSEYEQSSLAYVPTLFPGYHGDYASVAVQYRGAADLSIPDGFFSTADLLMESRLLPDGYPRPTVNLNFAVWRLDEDPAQAGRISGVTGWDMLGQRQRSFVGRTVVLSAGTIESAKIALQSQLRDPNQKIGRGITDHTIRYRHFTLPPGDVHADPAMSAKLLLRHPQASTTDHAFDVVVELGADFNQGRYVDPANLAKERADRNGWMLCELVFMSYAPLNAGNSITASGQPADPVMITMAPTPPSAAVLAEQDALAGAFFTGIGAAPVLGEPGGMSLQTAGLGNVAHEVGTMRMAADGSGVVDEDLKLLEYDNAYVCDNSVFPTSPAANPSLTLAALSLRLAARLH